MRRFFGSSSAPEPKKKFAKRRTAKKAKAQAKATEWLDCPPPKGISGKLLAVTIQCGARSFSLFITDERSTLRLYYTNEYNYSDVFHLTTQTKRKLAFSRSTAFCYGKSLFNEIVSHSNYFVKCYY
uniref:hypothetical protein n=1 Tax=Alloprevotella sp. TaxID=1872471 RepID=UPI004027D690